MILRRSLPQRLLSVWKVIQNVESKEPKLIAEEELLIQVEKIEVGMDMNEIMLMVEEKLLSRVETETTAMYGLPKVHWITRVHEDWYCSECQMPGDLVPCVTCSRGFHSNCIEGEALPYSCATCSSRCDWDQHVVPPEDTRRTLKILFGLISEKISESQDLILEHGLEEWMKQILCHKPLDIFDIENNVNQGKYLSLHDFRSDFQTLIHNDIILYGRESKNQEVDKFLFSQCLCDLNEIRLCVDCYVYSNTKPCDEWFCLPCKNSHKLVYAMAPKCPYWPAKVINITDDHQYDVRFFGPTHPRATLPSSSIVPISTDQIPAPVPKNSPTFLAAKKELMKHLELLFLEDSGMDVGGILCGTAREAFTVEQEEKLLEQWKDKRYNETMDVIIRGCKSEIEELRWDITKLYPVQERVSAQVAAVLKKKWCFNDDCQQKAKIHCCFTADYCSEECKNKHWENGHQSNCYHIDD